MFWPEPVIINFFVARLLFGANQRPELTRTIGKAIREFQDMLLGKEDKFSINETQNARSDFLSDDARRTARCLYDLDY